MAKDGATNTTQPISPKHEQFCQLYIKTLNATQSYIGAGYSPNGANTSASKLLANPNIQARIAELRDEIALRNQIDHDDLTQTLAKVAFSDIGHYFTKNGEVVRNLHELPKHHRQAVKTFKHKTTTYTYEDGSQSVKVEREVTLHDPLRAVDQLAKHLGYYEEHNKQKSTRIDLSGLTNEELERRLEIAEALEGGNMKVAS